MKKLFIAILAIVLAGSSASAELTKQQEKQVKKEVKAKVKELQKENWKILGSTRTLDAALTKHIGTLTDLGDNAYEVVGLAGNFKSKNIGKQQAINNACATYAQNAGSSLKGRVVSDMTGDGSDETSAKEFDHFYAAYERHVEKEIKNEMKESFSIIRELPNGTSEIQTFYVVNEDAASNARMRALENAAKESELAQKQAEKVANFVRSGFDK